MVKAKKEKNNYQKNVVQEDTIDDLTKANQNEDGKADNSNDSLTHEIARLKKVVAEKEEIIDDLVLERNDVYDEIYELRLTLEKAWNISRATDAEKIWEVLRLTSKKTETQRDMKPYSAAVKFSDNRIEMDTTAQVNNETNLTICSNTDSTDSGIGMYSLTQLIDDRINLVVDAKPKKSEHAICGTKLISNQDEIIPFTPVHVNLDQEREKNVIIHGLKEGEICDSKLVEDIFAATATQYGPAYMIRLGTKNNDKSRPLMLRMKNKDEKEEFMSKLWMLKNVRTWSKNISITNDYTLEERRLMKKWVEEANKRNTIGTNEYRWKVRGTPREGLRLVKIMNQE